MTALASASLRKQTVLLRARRLSKRTIKQRASVYRLRIFTAGVNFSGKNVCGLFSRGLIFAEKVAKSRPH